MLRGPTERDEEITEPRAPRRRRTKLRESLIADEPPQETDLVGKMVGGRYRIQGEIGGGTAGKVYEAVQEPIGRPVAIKVLRPELRAEDRDTFEKRFMREAALTGALQHPNIVTVHDFGRTPEGWCYTVMELIRGTDLRTIMRRGPMELGRALDIFEQVVRGLGSAHEAGLVHRDVKPANIVLMEGFQGKEVVKILDFGLVKDSDDSGLTAHGTMMGTPRYMPPEQAKGEVVDHRADLYSVGVMMYEALTGVSPYEASTAMTMALCHIREPYPPMATRAPNAMVPAEAEAIVRRCMEKRPEDRYASATHLLADLRSLHSKIDELGSFDDVPPGPVTPLKRAASMASDPAARRHAKRQWNAALNNPVIKVLAVLVPLAAVLVVVAWLGGQIQQVGELARRSAPANGEVEVEESAATEAKTDPADVLVKRPRKRRTRPAAPAEDAKPDAAPEVGADGLPLIAPEASLDGASAGPDLALYNGTWVGSDGDTTVSVQLRLTPDGKLGGELVETVDGGDRTASIGGFYKSIDGGLEVQIAELGAGSKTWLGVLRDDHGGRLQPKGGGPIQLKKR